MTNNAERELLPCPFCGHKPIVWPNDDEHVFAIYCQNCAAINGEHSTERAAIGAWNTRAQASGVPDGWKLVPEKFAISEETWGALQYVFGGPGTGEDEPYLNCMAWVGELDEDDGSKTYGIHLSCDECPEEGSVTIAEFTAPTPLKFASVPVDRLEALIKHSGERHDYITVDDLAELIAEYKA